MLSKFKSWLSLEQEGSRRLTESKPDPQLAVCAILLEVAHADNDFAAVERETIVQLLRERFDLTDSEVEGLIALTEEERRNHPDLWAFTNIIGRTYSPEEKLTVLVMVWRVIFADQVLDAHEDMLMRKLQHMLAVNHSLVVKAKQMARTEDGAS